MAQEQEIDIRAQSVLDGLSQLRTLLEEPITRHALDLANNAKTASQHDILNRTYRSLLQYLTIEGDLFYVGLLGHFSTGKSSTINSILSVSGTKDERPTGLGPTDSTISLITRPTNEKYLLGVIREGSVTIRSRPIDHPLLDNVVLVDTPGTGDPAQLEEIVRDFLPICDVILFFFSAASPLDTNDKPHLEQLQKRLPFVPIHFIVTRADELRRDILAPVSAENIDPTKRVSFFDDVLDRLNKLLTPKQLYTEEHFALIDNKHNYNISSVEQIVRSKSDPTDSRTRVLMHGHKLNYYVTMAKELRGFFETFLDNKLRELTKIVHTAESNRDRYTENVEITNNNLTKAWIDQLAAINSERERSLKLLAEPEELPGEIEGFEPVRKRRQEVTEDILEEAQRTARHVGEALRLRISSIIIEQIRDHDLTGLESPRANVVEGSKEITLAAPRLELNAVMPLLPSLLINRWGSLREAKVSALREAASKLRKAFEETTTLVQTGSPFSECEKIVQGAQKSLVSDLKRFFGNAELYRAGVFSHTTKESIGALGLGKELDDLESEFGEADSAPFITDAIQRVFPNFSEIASDARTEIAAIDKNLRPQAARIGELKIPSPEGHLKQLYVLIDEESQSLAREISAELRDNVALFLGTLGAKLSTIVIERRRSYTQEIANAKKQRRILYAGALLLGIVLSVGSYFAYIHAFDIPSNNFHAVLWNVVAALIVEPIVFFIAKGVDKFPKRSATIRLENQAILRRDLEATAEKEILSFEFAAISTPNLTKRLSRAYQNLIGSDPDSWNMVAADRLNVLREVNSEFRKIRAAYVGLTEAITDKVSAYFSNASKNLQLLNDVADRIKARAIEPSFKLLEDTRSSLDRIKQQVHEIEFG